MHELNTLVLKSNDWWVGLILDHSICIQSRSVRDVPNKLREAWYATMEIHKHEGIPYEPTPANADYYSRFQQVPLRRCNDPNPPDEFGCVILIE